MNDIQTTRDKGGDLILERATIKKARKEHTCSNCGDKILVNNHYYSDVWKPFEMVEDNGRYYTYKYSY